MPPEFGRFWTFVPTSGELKALSDGPGEQLEPVVLATETGSHAMGVFFPGPPPPGLEAVRYGRWRFQAEKVNKWNCVLRLKDPKGVASGEYRFKMFVVVGSLDDVKTTLTALVKERDGKYLCPTRAS